MPRLPATSASPRAFLGWSKLGQQARQFGARRAWTLLKGRVADYKLPEQLELLPDLPMTPTGNRHQGSFLDVELLRDN